MFHGFECFIRRDTQRLGKKDKWSSTEGSRTGAPDGQNDEGGLEPWPSDVEEDRLMSRAQTEKRPASILPSATSENTVNDNDTLREVPHPSSEGLALQARVSGS